MSLPRTSHAAQVDSVLPATPNLCLATYPALLRHVQVAVFEFHVALCNVPRYRALLASASLSRRTLVRIVGPTCTIELFERPARVERHA
jgi:hypothetical protein